MKQKVGESKQTSTSNSLDGEANHKNNE